MTELYHLILLLILAIALSRNLLKTAHGLSFLAVREDELAADATGVFSTKVKVVAFTLGAMIAGMAGALFAHYNKSVSPDDFKMDVSFMLVAMVVIGGTGSITGAVIAGIGLKMLEEGLRALPGIPATTLYALVTALVIAFIGYSQIVRRLSAANSKSWNTFLLLPGSIGIIAALFGAYRVYSADVSVVIKIALTVIALTMTIAMLLPSGRKSALPKFGSIIMVILLTYGLSFLTKAILASIPSIHKILEPINYQAADLRWAIFSLALVVVMLTRPQGIMSHHEFSWDSLKKLFGRKHGTVTA
jgi:branched-chain amino acid transport system permease protein